MNDQIEFRLDKYISLIPSRQKPTWRHRVYWRLRRMIDWMHPK